MRILNQVAVLGLKKSTLSIFLESWIKQIVAFSVLWFVIKNKALCVTMYFAYSLSKPMTCYSNLNPILAVTKDVCLVIGD